MKTGDALDMRSATVQHKNKVKNLQDRQKNERTNLENNHKVNMARQRVSNASQLNDLKVQQNQKLLEENLKYESKLLEMKNALDKVKEQTQKEIVQLKKDHETKKEVEKQVFEANYQGNKDRHQMILQDLDQEANIQMEKLQRRTKLKEHEVSKMHDKEKKFMQNSHITHMNIKKEQFAEEKIANEGKFEKNLRLQKRDHTNKLADNERVHQNKIVEKKKLYDKQNQSIQSYGLSRKKEIQTRYEKKFEQMFAKEEFKLQHLKKNQEKILNELKARLKKDLKLSLSKDNDPFYNNVSLEPKLTETKKGYELKIPVPKYDADKMNLTGSERTLKLTMDRHYEFSHEDNGKTNTVKKVETFVSKIPVEKIIDPKTIQRSYNEGIMTFNIELA